MYNEITYFTSFMIGILGSFHCFGMCGVLSTFLFFNIDKFSNQKKLFYQFIYNFGRICSYVFLGFLFSFFGFITNHFFGNITIFFFKLLSGFSLILYFFYIKNIFNYNFIILEKFLYFFWKKLFAFDKNINTINFIKVFIFGIFWGFLPCGLVYTAILYSFSSSISSGCLSMLFFGFGTLPSMFIFSFFFKSFFIFLKKNIYIKLLFEIFIFLFGVFIIFDSFVNYGKC